MIVIAPDRQFALNSAGLQDHPFLAWDNFAAPATLSGTATLAGGDRFNGVLGSTAEFWLPDPAVATARFEVDLGTARELTCAAIAAHTLADHGLTASIERSADGSTWTTTGAAHAPADGAPVFWRFSPVTARYWRLVVTGIDPAHAPAVGVVFFGTELIMLQRVYSGVAPVIAATQVELASNVSVGGHLMGSSVVSRGARLPLDFRSLTAGFVRGPFRPFLRHFNEGRGFFVAWRPEEFPEDVHYGWRDGPVIQPVNSGTLDHQTLSIAARVHHDW